MPHIHTLLAKCVYMLGYENMFSKKIICNLLHVFLAESYLASGRFFLRLMPEYVHEGMSSNRSNVFEILK